MPKKTKPKAKKSKIAKPRAAKPKAKGVQAIPEGFYTVTPHLTVKRAADAIAFYRKAFGAQELHRMTSPDGEKIMHAVIRIGDSIVMLADEFETCSGPSALGSPVTLHLYVADADRVYERAVSAGAQIKMPIMDMFWGDRYGQVTDPFGHHWSIATHQRDVAPEDMTMPAREAFSQPTAQ